MKIFVATLALVLAAACVPPTVAKRRITFAEEMYAPYDKPGTGVIKGQAFLKTRGGDVKFAAGGKVYCNPATSYGQEWFNRAVIDGVTLEPGDPRAAKYVRETTADAFGNFEFTGLPPGSYYIAAPIYWEVPSRSGYYIHMQTTGAHAYARARLHHEGEVVKVIVTR